MNSIAWSSQILKDYFMYLYYSFHSLEKINHNSGGKYECVFLTDPVVQQTIEVKSKSVIEYQRSKLLSLVISKLPSVFAFDL